MLALSADRRRRPSQPPSPFDVDVEAVVSLAPLSPAVDAPLPLETADRIGLRNLTRMSGDVRLDTSARLSGGLLSPTLDDFFFCCDCDCDMPSGGRSIITCARAGHSRDVRADAGAGDRALSPLLLLLLLLSLQYVCVAHYSRRISKQRAAGRC